MGIIEITEHGNFHHYKTSVIFARIGTTKGRQSWSVWILLNFKQNLSYTGNIFTAVIANASKSQRLNTTSSSCSVGIIRLGMCVCWGKRCSTTRGHLETTIVDMHYQGT